MPSLSWVVLLWLCTPFSPCSQLLWGIPLSAATAQICHHHCAQSQRWQLRRLAQCRLLMTRRKCTNWKARWLEMHHLSQIRSSCCAAARLALGTKAKGQQYLASPSEVAAGRKTQHSWVQTHTKAKFAIWYVFLWGVTECKGNRSKNRIKEVTKWAVDSAQHGSLHSLQAKCTNRCWMSSSFQSSSDPSRCT